MLSFFKKQKLHPAPQWILKRTIFYKHVGCLLYEDELSNKQMIIFPGWSWNGKTVVKIPKYVGISLDKVEPNGHVIREMK